MSRALNLAATEAEVIAMCAKHSAPISSIETLHSGGTRLVLKNGDAAAIIGRAFGKKVITGTVTRTPMRVVERRAPVEAEPKRRSRWED